MKGISPQFKAHIQSGVLTIAAIWTITRKDGTTFRYTSHQRKLKVGGHWYLPRVGADRTAIASTSNLSVDNLEVKAVFDDELISERDLRSGLWDGALVEIAIVNFRDTTQGIVQRSGWIGEVTMKNGGFTAELRGLTQPVHENVVGESYTPTCRLDFCGAKCGLSAAAFTFSGTVSEIVSPTEIAVGGDAGTKPDGFFSGGTLTWTSGQNAGAKVMVKSWTGGHATLFQPMPYPITSGDSFDVLRSCDKVFSTCVGFGNAINFGGEPHVPGDDYRMRGV